MNKPTNGKSLQDAKRQIAQKSKDFESRLTKAKNAFEQIVVLNDMQEIIEAEIFAWTNLLSTEQEDTEQDDEQLISDAAEHVSNLNDFILTLNKQRLAILPDALKIQRAMINSHQLKAPILKED